MPKLKGKKVAVLGGSGFFGSHMVSFLTERAIKVNVPRRSVYDFRKRSDCLKYFNRIKPNVVINCAAFQGGIGFHKGKQADLFMDNMLMGCNLMEAAQTSGVRKFVNVVAGCAYPGYLDKQVMSEDDLWSGDVHDSIFSYGFSRKATIVYGKALNKQYGFKSIHLLLANMYGPGDHFDPNKSKALAALIRKIYEAKNNSADEVEIWGTGKPLRDWLYVKDGAAGVVRAAEVYDEIEPLNIATGKGVTVTELAENIRSAVGYDGKFVYNTDKPDGALKKIFSAKKMKKQLGWSPKTSIKKGIKETVKWFDANYKSAISR
ncbi:NAD-dependent epimerase/dehydratase family protein [Patescibacteria group bacterium]